MHKSFIGKHTLHKILSIIKTDLTTNHNHDHRYYTEEEVNQLLNQQKEEFINTFKVKKISLNETTNITNANGQRVVTYHTEEDLTTYKELCISVYIKDYAPLTTITIPIYPDLLHPVHSIYVEDLAKQPWSGYIDFSTNTIRIITQPDSTHVNINYLIIHNCLAKSI